MRIAHYSAMDKVVEKTYTIGEGFLIASLKSFIILRRG